MIYKTTTSIEKINKNCLKLYDNLDKTDMIDELHQRKVKFNCNDTKAKLGELLIAEMKGIQRAPAVLFYNQDENLIDDYEILQNEPMHDIAGHLKNLFEELPLHLNKKERELFENSMMVYLSRDNKRACDYRKAVIFMCVELNGKINETILCILSTACTMQRILYANEKERDVATILRYHLASYVHADLLSELTLKKLKSRRMFGKYYHSLIRHAGLQLRIVSGKSAHTEQEERNFQQMKKIANLTSNHHPKNVIFNIWIRLQAKVLLDEKNNSVQKENSKIKELSKCLPEPVNTFISYEHIKKKSSQWQAFIETKISDFLSEGVWWTSRADRIEFFDFKNNNQTNLKIHHFRSSNINKEESSLKEMWSLCLKKRNILIPANKIKDEINGKTEIHYLSTLSFFGNNTNNNIDMDLTSVINQENPETDNHANCLDKRDTTDFREN